MEQILVDFPLEPLFGENSILIEFDIFLNYSYNISKMDLTEKENIDNKKYNKTLVEKRLNNNSFEKKRRDYEMKAFEKLKKVIGSKNCNSRIQILRKAIAKINYLKNQDETIISKLKILKSFNYKDIYFFI